MLEMRLATAAEDGPDLGACFGRYRDWMGIAGPTDEEFAREVIISMAQDAEFLVSGDPICGFSYYRFERSLWLRAESCVLEILFVDAASRRSGLGRALLRETEARARKRGASRMEFHANEQNRRAVRLYESEGFLSHNAAYNGRDLYYRKSWRSPPRVAG